MTDPRVEKLAKLLVEYSLSIKKGQKLLITGDAEAATLIQACYRAALRAGAFVETAVIVDGLDEIFYAEASDQQLRYVSPFHMFRVKTIDARLTIRAETNTKNLSNADFKRVAKRAAANKPIKKIFFNRAAKGDLRWTLTQWPTNAFAQDAEMSLAEYEDFIFTAGHLDDADPIKTWREIDKSQKALQQLLNRTGEIRIVAADTDITLSVRGRKWINACGHENFPDGEVFTGPVETAVNGHVRFNFPVPPPSIVSGGKECDGVRLEFRDGKLVSAQADKGKDFLKSMITMDKGACYLGELAFGLNYNIKRYTRCTLFDEKIGGTVHMALGSGYPETGSKNESGLHWDMVCDMRKGGQIFADGKCIQKDGRFFDKRFPQPTK